ncbi:MAG: TIGR04283 family arsenosugar biosynthesis glycosyltransferase [Mogibacterium sp.]|nr:TIGR04283 family arsenosugar biosynthesis glycosyltransferase [Mogibacterium sp.]
MKFTQSHRSINNHRNALIIFTREPVPGKTKTRLMPCFSAEQCAELHRCFLRDIAKEMKKADADIIVAYTGGEPLFLRRIFGKKTIFFEQRGEGLGEKMENAISDAISFGYEKVVLIGSDIPEIEAESVDTALAMLDICDVVIGPTADGGYYLIGMKESHHEAFDVKLYGVSTVFEETIASMRKAGLSVEPADTYSDIDTPEDAAEFRSRMREDSGLRRSHTGKFLTRTAKISVIVPVYNEETSIGALAEQLRSHDGIEAILVDGGSTDRTIDMAGDQFRIVQSDKGRGIQMNTGALASSGDILFFLHCDSVIPKDFDRQIRQVISGYEWGCFGVRFSSRNFFMLTNRLISNHRAFFRGIPFGDQGIFIDRKVFFEMGMFPELPLMEDYEFSRKMKRYGLRPGMTRNRITTSSRRYGTGTADIVKTEIGMWNLRRLFRKGVSPDVLSKKYKDIR